MIGPLPNFLFYFLLLYSENISSTDLLEDACLGRPLSDLWPLHLLLILK